MKNQAIVAEFVKSNNSDNMVWHVYVTESDSPEQQGFCKKAYSALQFCFILKARTGVAINNDTVQMLKKYYAENEREARWARIQAQKEAEAKAEQPAEEAPEQEQPKEEQPKKRGRKPGARKAKKEEVAA